MKKLPIFTFALFTLLGLLFYFALRDFSKNGESGWTGKIWSGCENFLHLNHKNQADSKKTASLESPVETETSADLPSFQLNDAEKTEQKALTQQADLLIQNALQNLKQYHAIEARMKEYIFMKGVKYTGTGKYMQSGNRKMRLEIQMQAGSSTGQLLQISDGQLLWTEYKKSPIPEDLPEDQLSHYYRVERRNLGRIEDRLVQLGDPDTAKHFWELGSGGLSALLASFQDSLEFTVSQPQAIKGIPCYVLTGQLNEKSVEIMKYLKKKREFIAQDSLPTKVVLYIDQQQLFPLRYEYYRRESGNRGISASSS